MLNRDIGVIGGWKILWRNEFPLPVDAIPESQHMQDDLVEASCDLDHVVLQPEHIKTEESPNKVTGLEHPTDFPTRNNVFSWICGIWVLGGL